MSFESRLSKIPSGPTMNANCPDFVTAKNAEYAEIAAQNIAPNTITPTAFLELGTARMPAMNRQWLELLLGLQAARVWTSYIGLQLLGASITSRRP